MAQSVGVGRTGWMGGLCLALVLLGCGTSEHGPAAAGGSNGGGSEHGGGSPAGGNAQGGGASGGDTPGGKAQGGSGLLGGAPDDEAPGGNAQGGQGPSDCDGADLQTDHDHCGDCDHACTLGQQCQAGGCACPAGGPADFCDGIGCVDLKANAKHCGECSIECRADQTCQAGVCDCPAGKLACDDACVDVKTDTANCGKCGNACPSGQACDGGECGCTGASLTACGDGCANLSIDPLNCGKCEHACAAGETCNGQCQCLSGVYCGSVCEPQNDDGNCGACGTVCPQGQSCKGASCKCDGVGLTQCGSDCVDATSDELHCGSCDIQCRKGETCSASKCKCPQGQTYCDTAGQCVDLLSDAEHCSACDKACPASQVCDNGSCQCPDPTVGSATRLTNNSLHDERPVAAWDGTHVGLAYLRQIDANGSSYNLRFALLSSDGTVVKDVAITSYVAADNRSVGTNKLSPLLDQVGMTWNGSEYAIVYDDVDLSKSESNVLLVRVSPAAVAAAPVTVVTNAELPGSSGPSIVWSVPYGGYIISGSVAAQAYYRRVGAQGTSLEAPVPMVAGYCNTALAVDPGGRMVVSSVSSSDGYIRYYDADGTKKPTDVFGPADRQVKPESVFDGTTFDTVVSVDTSGVNLDREGSTYSRTPLVPAVAGVHQYAVDAVWTGGSLALGTLVNPSAGVYKLDRFTLTAGDKSAIPVKIQNTLTVVSTVHGKPELLQVGSSKLLAIWPDNRSGATTELYAAPIDLKSCP